MKRFIAKVSKSFKGGQKGFTLIELLIVIVILGVLAAAIIPNLSKFVGSGTVGAANAELASVRTAVSAYVADNNGTYPTGPAHDGAAGTVVGGNGDIVNAAIQGYITGSTIKAEYTIVVATGVITGTDDSYAAGIDWDAVNQKWYKP